MAHKLISSTLKISYVYVIIMISVDFKLKTNFASKISSSNKIYISSEIED